MTPAEIRKQQEIYKQIPKKPLTTGEKVGALIFVLFLVWSFASIFWDTCDHSFWLFASCG
jgi:hypothetical protein